MTIYYKRCKCGASRYEKYWLWHEPGEGAIQSNANVKFCPTCGCRLKNDGYAYEHGGSED